MNRRPTDGELLNRKLDAVRKVLRLERERGYRDEAVFGGVDRFLERSVEDPEVRLALTAAEIGVPRYALLDLQARRSWVDASLKALETAAHAKGSEEPGPSPASLLRSRGPGRRPRASPSPQRAASRLAPGRGHEASPSRPFSKAAGSPKALRHPTSLDDPLPLPPALMAKFIRLGLRTYRDALYAFPRRYVEIVRISGLVGGVEQAIAVTVWEASARQFGRRRLQAAEAVVGDETGSVRAVWFGRTYVARSLKPGARFLLTGRATIYRGTVRFDVETEEPLGPSDVPEVGHLLPVYPSTEGVTQRSLRRYVTQAVERATPLVQDYLPQDIRQRIGLPSLPAALRELHALETSAERDAARHRLAFDELLMLQLGLLDRRRQWREEQRGVPLPADSQVLQRFRAILPFSFTSAQERALQDILHDLGQMKPMSRMLQGDVGSGKTVVATAALLTAAGNGYQGAMMAPTEILAEQHFSTVTALFSRGQRSKEGGPYRGFQGLLDRPLRVALLTGSVSRKAKADLRQLIARGHVDIVIGTHALIQAEVEFTDLGLVIVDEQHRFGVEQRAALHQKGSAPHLLVMTATPIPRTLALTLYGDLDISIIDELPPGRAETKTRALSPDQRESAYRFIRRQVEEGRQAFIICPLVEESDAVEAKAAIAEHERLSREVFPDLRLGLLHGRMPPREKEQVMKRFHSGELDILVSTAVVEVGIDVPNATVMLVEGAERFGLAQLHQYRGRVGRAEHQSYCILVSGSATPEAQERLKLVESTRDGFQLAEADLLMRGPGEFFGTRQSGLLDLRVARFSDIPILEEAREQALALYQKDPGLVLSEHQALREEVARFWARAEEAPGGSEA